MGSFDLDPGNHPPFSQENHISHLNTCISLSPSGCQCLTALLQTCLMKLNLSQSSGQYHKPF